MQRRDLVNADRRRAADGANPRRLIRLMDELRALDLERRRQPVASAAFHELAGRVEAKARQVFEEAAVRPPSALHADPESARRAPH
jgi:hypothetical protein